MGVSVGDELSPWQVERRIYFREMEVKICLGVAGDKRVSGAGDGMWP